MITIHDSKSFAWNWMPNAKRYRLRSFSNIVNAHCQSLTKYKLHHKFLLVKIVWLPVECVRHNNRARETEGATWMRNACLSVSARWKKWQHNSLFLLLHCHWLRSTSNVTQQSAADWKWRAFCMIRVANQYTFWHNSCVRVWRVSTTAMAFFRFRFSLGWRRCR